MDEYQNPTEPKQDIGSILEGGRQPAADVPAGSQEHYRDQSDARGPGDNQSETWTYSAMRAERQKRQALAARVKELEEENESWKAVATYQEPDPKVAEADAFWGDPVGVLKEQQVQSNFRASRAEFVAEHGRGALKQLESVLEKAFERGHPDLPIISERMRASDDPVGVALQWAQSVGSRGGYGGGGGTVFPSNLAGARNVGHRSGPQWGGQSSLDQIFAQRDRPKDIFKR